MITRLLLLSAFVLAGGCASGGSNSTATKHYMCPMHKEVTSTSPGKCAKCGKMLAATQPATQPAAESKGAHKH